MSSDLDKFGSISLKECISNGKHHNLLKKQVSRYRKYYDIGRKTHSCSAVSGL